MAGNTLPVQQQDSGLLDLARTVGAIAPQIFPQKSSTTQSQSPASLNSGNALIAQLMPGVSGTSQYSDLISNILRRSAEAFGPTRAAENAAGGYNSSSLALLKGDAEARATAEASDAVLKAQQEAARTIASVVNTQAVASKQTQTRQEPGIPPAVSGIVTALLGANAAKNILDSGAKGKAAVAAKPGQPGYGAYGPGGEPAPGSPGYGAYGPGGETIGAEPTFTGMAGSDISGTGISTAGGGGGAISSEATGVISGADISNTIDLATQNASANSALFTSSGLAANPGEGAAIVQPLSTPNIEGTPLSYTPPLSDPYGGGSLDLAASSTPAQATGGGITGFAGGPADLNAAADLGSADAGFATGGSLTEGELFGGATSGTLDTGLLAAPAVAEAGAASAGGFTAAELASAAGSDAALASGAGIGAGELAVGGGAAIGGGLIAAEAAAAPAESAGLGVLIEEALPILLATVICTELYSQGKISEEDWKLSGTWAKANLSDTTRRGYRCWAVPYVSIMKSSKLATWIGLKLVKPYISTLKTKKRMWLPYYLPCLACYILGKYLEIRDSLFHCFAILKVK